MQSLAQVALQMMHLTQRGPDVFMVTSGPAQYS